MITVLLTLYPHLPIFSTSSLLLPRILPFSTSTLTSSPLMSPRTPGMYFSSSSIPDTNTVCIRTMMICRRFQASIAPRITDYSRGVLTRDAHEGCSRGMLTKDAHEGCWRCMSLVAGKIFCMINGRTPEWDDTEIYTNWKD